MTSAPYLTGGSLTGSWVTRLLTNSLDQTFIASVPAGNYFYFAHPQRMGQAVFQINDAGIGGLDPQGYDVVPGVSANSYGNLNGYVEDYFIYRTNNSGIGNNVKFDTGSNSTEL